MVRCTRAGIGMPTASHMCGSSGGHGRRKTLDHLCNRKRCVRPDHLWPISETLNSHLRHARALTGSLAYWRDAAGVHLRMRSVERWASANSLPYGDLPPFGRDGARPPTAYSRTSTSSTRRPGYARLTKGCALGSTSCSDRQSRRQGQPRGAAPRHPHENFPTRPDRERLGRPGAVKCSAGGTSPQHHLS